MDRMIRRTLIFLMCITPPVVRFVLFMGKLVLTTVLAFWTGVPEVVDRMSKYWMEQAWNSNIPTEYDTILHWIFIVVAYVMIFAGWIGFSCLTVFLLTRLF